MSAEEQKRVAAEAAVALVEPGMVVGLGTGSTAAYAIDALIRRVAAGLDIVAIPTSERSAAQAKAGGIRLTDYAEYAEVDLTIDGADEIAPGLELVKGLGGALLREKIVAASSRRLVIVADDSKLVPRLGSKAPVPVEVVAFGWQSTASRLTQLGARPMLREAADGTPFRTDGDNLILDCAFHPIADQAALELAISRVVGVVESGLFIGMANLALVAGAAGVRRIERS